MEDELKKKRLIVYKCNFLVWQMSIISAGIEVAESSVFTNDV